MKYNKNVVNTNFLYINKYKKLLKYKKNKNIIYILYKKYILILKKLIYLNII